MVTVAKLAQLLSGKIISGDKDTVITSISGLKEAQAGDITFLSNTKYLPFLATTRASAVLVGESFIKELPHLRVDLILITVANPDLAFIKVAEYFKPDTVRPKKGVDKKAVIGKKVKLGKNVAIQPFVVIEDGASIGDNTVIYPNVYIGQGSTLGQNCILYPNVVIREKTVIGRNVIIHSGTVIGSDGFGYVVVGGDPAAYGGVKGVRHKIPQLGTVVIEDDVEIGANVAIDRARFDKTIIRRGTKIDNLVHIAHNVEIGENSVLVAQVGIAGSAKIGKNVILAGQSGVDGHIRVGDNAVVTAKSGVMKDVPPGAMVSGFPARPHTEQLREQATLRKLSKTNK